MTLKSTETKYEKLMELTSGYLPQGRMAQVQRAFEYAREAHEGENRLSGEPFVEHPLQVAISLAELQLDANALSAALLHDVPEDKGVPISEIEEKFGHEVARLVDGVTKFGKLTKSGDRNDETQLQNLRKMLVAMAEDVRVVFIKLADRLHNMRTLGALPPAKQLAIARETQEIYAPLAHRLGIWEFKWQLEDLAFRYLDTERYKQVASTLATRRVEREAFINEVIEVLHREFAAQDVMGEISGRPKHIYSIHQKMQRYSAQGKAFSDIHDLLALRVLVPNVADCYTALGVIHSLWRPIPGAFDDYIASPKPNGYQSLHTAVVYRGTTPLEVQIRTHEMHHLSEYGIAAHWRYKEEAGGGDIRFEERVGWLRQLIEWHREMSQNQEFLESVKTDILIDQVFVFTPKGEIKDMPKGATPLDLAYRIHTEVGHHCVGAKVNTRLVSLNTSLHNGDVVEIMTTKSDKGPSRDWLNSSLGYVKTSQARVKIRQWFKKQERADNVERGKEILDREMRRLGITNKERAELPKLFSHENLEDFLIAVGNGDITARQIALVFVAEEERAVPPAPAPRIQAPASSVKVLGVGDVLTHLAPCCHPVPGDPIIGYITRSRGVTVHRTDCSNIMNESEPERLVPVEWAQTGAFYPVSVQVEGWDRVGLLRDITTVVAEEKVNIASITLKNKDDGTSTVTLQLETRGLTQLVHLMAVVEAVRGVVSVRRLSSEPPPSPAARKPAPEKPRKRIHLHHTSQN